MGPNVQLLVRRVPGSTHASPTPGEKISWENLREFFRFRKRRICFGEAIKVFPILGPTFDVSVPAQGGQVEFSNSRSISTLRFVNKYFGSECSWGLLGYILARGIDVWRRGASIHDCGNGNVELPQRATSSGASAPYVY